MPCGLELIAVYGLAADDAFGFVGHLLVVHVEVVLDGVGHVTALGVVVDVGGAFLHGLSADYFALLPVVDDVCAMQGEEQLRLVGPGCLHSVEVLEFAQFRGFQYLVHLLTGGEQCLPSVLGVDGKEGVNLRLDALVAPPLQAV